MLTYGSSLWMKWDVSGLQYVNINSQIAVVAVLFEKKNWIALV